MANSLSGRFLILTIIFVMIAEIFIFVPSVARFREDYLLARLERAQIASLAVEVDAMISPALEAELLENAEIYNVVLRRDQIRQLALSSKLPAPVAATYDMRAPSGFTLVADALRTLVQPEERIIRVIGHPVRDGGQLIEITMDERPMQLAMRDYGRNILILSAFISVMTAGLLFLAVQILLVRPIKGVVAHMQSYAKAPEDARQIITPRASLRELRDAEVALQTMQTQLTTALRQKERLAQLGGAVAKVSHDLRNIMTSAQLFTDRIGGSDDPLVKRMAPKLVNSITRAVNLCETTLAFGRVDEPAPALTRVNLSRIVEDVVDSERLAAGDYPLSFAEDIPATMTLRADGEQLYRVIFNLVRNARQAIMATGVPGEIGLRADEDELVWRLIIRDTGPGMPQKAREHLFQPFQGGVRKGGAGLGLVIAADLVRGHGGRLELQESSAEGTTFVIQLPKADLALADAVQ
ncbi:sensor histidine kinase [Yoonia vestfoldensis]|jgi:signal transduction histidine kinase|uniref:histidine kinase n=1 Tax=Yoonia vestfoldensis TaxID=245188 RepID=A0A1Y0EDK0_9RHOB|nr:HAMP domain-containing sensor histidine kinase [Yoonia vestfoldensis]ARU01667.1 sensor protein ZraS [Yoonia vestfoldensis]